VRFSDKSKLRGEVFATEYLGTTQVVTLRTGHGQLRARIPASVVVRPGEHVGIELLSNRLSLFDKATGRAIRSALHEGIAHG
jgi:multiple sugar transport system ATP-binding protein